MKKDYEITKIWEIDIIKFSYPIDENTTLSHIFRQIEEVSKKRKIILDLSEVTFLNSTFIGYIFHIYETSNTIWWFVYLANINPNVKDILNLTWILDTIPYFSSVESAMKNIK